MLQQTQVSSVLLYYPRFLARFPDVQALASASEPEVLALWSGLGYYSRARNLHRCAQTVVSEFDGHFPASAQVLQTLPGIGRSTAAAIAAFCHDERVSILDGNVKRVMTRYLGFGEDLSLTKNERTLWEGAERLLPGPGCREDMPAYTQGLMDLGATVCTPRRPSCLLCPVVDECVAAREGEPERYPVKTRRLKRSKLRLFLLHLVDAKGRVWLSPRPSPGIWAGLECFPVFESHEALWAVLSSPMRASVIEHPAFLHVLTHRDLYLHVVTAQVESAGKLQLAQKGAWYDTAGWRVAGLPAPVRRFLDNDVTAVPTA